MTSMYEPVANTDLARLLDGMTGPATVEPEPPDVFPGGKRPDLLITAPGRSPVVIEARQLPAANLEEDAVARFPLHAVIGGRELEAVIALRYPAGMTALTAATPLEYAALTRKPGGGINRFPESGWLNGKAADLADLVRLVSVPQSAVDDAANFLQHGIEHGAEILDEEVDKLRPAIAREIAGLLGMENVAQTRRMACAIIANAMIFHERIAGMHDNIRPLRFVCGPGVANPQEQTLTAWADILKINYWPIFAIAKDILEQLPPDTAGRLLETMRQTTGKVNGTGVNNAHDLTGRVFQRLISDRKYLATFYTLPPSAALLARLAVAKLRAPSVHPEPVERRADESEGDFDWSDADAISRLRVGDFACGTGALLSAVYEQIAARHEQAGGDAEAIHPVMMEEVLYGCDVMPSAIHITGSTLSGIQPETGFGQSRLYTMPYGRQEDGTVKIGSLELLQSSSVMTLFNTSDPAMRTGSAGEETAAQINAEIPDAGFDLVIMNPPFTSNTKHYDSDDGVVNAAFAAFDASEEDQDDMASRLRVLASGTTYHGHAGLASAFVSLAHRKLKPGGVMALVLPFTAINGAAWEKFRQLIASEYGDVSVVSIAAAGDSDLSFSADTDMADCLIIACKSPSSRRGHYTSLRGRPQGFAHAAAIASGLIENDSIRTLEDGPYGGTPLTVGGEFVGESMDCPTDHYGNGWGVARILDASVAQVANSLSSGNLWLPGQSKILTVPMTYLKEVGQRGVDHQFFVSTAHKGPFVKVAPSPTATYPSLWNHNAKNETKLSLPTGFPDAKPRHTRHRWDGTFAGQVGIVPGELHQCLGP